jgi:NTP pyrophosphatase (non-canonical NTP hydrolase)
MSLTLDEFQINTRSTRAYPDKFKIIYPALGLAGEAGESLEHVKKMLRDDNAELSPERKDKLILELGDVLYYLAALAEDIDVTLSEVATRNMEKLAFRKIHGKIHGEGSAR